MTLTFPSATQEGQSSDPVYRVDREHRSSPRRPDDCHGQGQAVIRAEYGAQLANKVIYMHDSDAKTVRDFVGEYGNGLSLVTCQWVGDRPHSKWEAAA